MKMKENLVEGRGWERFNEPCFFFCQSEIREDLRKLRGVGYTSKPLIFVFPKLGEFRGGVVPLIIKNN